MFKPPKFPSKLLVLIFAGYVVCSSAMAESDWAKGIRKSAPANVTLTAVNETRAYVEIEGFADSNQDISRLMQSISKNGLGFPELQQIKRNREVSVFVLHVKPPR